MVSMLEARHIQDHGEANTTEQPHWGYPSRVLPCTKDQGTCEYLDAVYWMHDTSMLYTFIMWGLILGILVVWVAIRGWRMGGPKQNMGSLFDKLCDSVARAKRRWLLPDAPLKSVFGRVTRLQVAVLAVLAGYLLIFSLVGIVYKTWITPIKGSSEHNTRTGLGGFSDRIGALAYALTPFAVLLSNRESVLSLVTGIPYQHFNLIHRWLGRIIFVQSFVHTLGWTIVEGKLYRPQPSVHAEFMAQQYIVWGVLAMFFITYLTVFSTKRAIACTGYEFFKITHWGIALLYIGACWGHWAALKCWMIPSITLIFIDQGIRALRLVYLHYNVNKERSRGFKAAQADVRVLGQGDDVVLRLDFDHAHREAWKPGQHFYLTFPGLSIWQSHPFTPSSLPDINSTIQHHTYLMRVRRGQTATLAAIAEQSKVSTVLTGPYGHGFPSFEAQHILAVAGGTGITFTLPIAFEALRQNVVPQACVDLVWVVRKAQDLLWISSELTQLKLMLKGCPGFRVSIFVTRESGKLGSGRSTPTLTEMDTEKGAVNASQASLQSDQSAMQGLLEPNSPRFSVRFLGDHHPSMAEIVEASMEHATNAGGAVEIVGSGPDAMASDLRCAVARVKENDGLNFYWDSRE